MNAYWLKGCEIDSIGARVLNAAHIIEIVAERVSIEPESGALWGARDMLEELGIKLELIASDMMHIEEPKKEKKK